MGLLFVAAGVVTPIPASAAGATVEVKIFNAAGTTELFTWSASIDLPSAYTRFAAGHGGRSGMPSGEGQVSIDDLVVTRADGSSTTFAFNSAPAIIESSQGSTRTVLRHDASAGGRLLAVADGWMPCIDNYQSIAIDSAVRKVRFKFSRLTGITGEGTYWDTSIGLMPSDHEAMGTSCGRPDNMLGIVVEGNGDGDRNSVRGWADGFQSPMSIGPTIGTTYIAEISLKYTGAPSNDHFANAINIASLAFIDSKDTETATIQSGEPSQPCGIPVGRSVWYKLTSPTTRAIEVTTTNYETNFDTVLVVYTGSSPTALSIVQCNDDSWGTSQSTIAFTAQAGVTYHIQVSGHSGQGGTAGTAFSAAPTAPRDPTAVTEGAGNIRVRWNPPASTGGSLQAYRVYGSNSDSNYMLLAELSDQQTSYFEQGLEPGPRYYKVTALNGVGESVAATVNTRAYADYRVEMRAWIPHNRVVDPDAFFTPYSWAYMQWTHGNCNAHPDNNGDVTPHFKGDGHRDFSDGSQTFRVRTMLQFRWDGRDITSSDNRPNEAHFGETERKRDYLFLDGHRESCTHSRATATLDWNAYTLSASSFRLDYSSANPMVSSSPTIDGLVQAYFDASGNLKMDITTDEFPSHGVRVIKNGITQLTHLSTDATCFGDDEVMGVNGMHEIAAGLVSSQSVQAVTVQPQDRDRWSNVMSEGC